MVSTLQTHSDSEQFVSFFSEANERDAPLRVTKEVQHILSSRPQAIEIEDAEVEQFLHLSSDNAKRAFDALAATKLKADPVRVARHTIASAGLKAVAELVKGEDIENSRWIDQVNSAAQTVNLGTSLATRKVSAAFLLILSTAFVAFFALADWVAAAGYLYATARVASRHEAFLLTAVISLGLLKGLFSFIANRSHRDQQVILRYSWVVFLSLVIISVFAFALVYSEAFNEGDTMESLVASRVPPWLPIATVLFCIVTITVPITIEMLKAKAALLPTTSAVAPAYQCLTEVARNSKRYVAEMLFLREQLVEIVAEQQSATEKLQSELFSRWRAMRRRRMAAAFASPPVSPSNTNNHSNNSGQFKACSLQHFSGVMLLLFMLGTAGCSSDVKSFVPTLSDASTDEVTEPQEILIIVSADFADAASRSILKITKTLPTGSQIAVVEASTMRLLGRISIPDGETGLFRQRKIGAKLRAIDKALKELGASTATPKDQIAFESISRTVDAMRATTLPARLLFFGTPIFDGRSPSSKAWSFSEGRVISDFGVWWPECPLNPRTRVLPPKTTAVIVTPPEWGDGENHRQWVERFWSLWFDGCGNANLLGITSDPQRGLTQLISNHDTIHAVPQVASDQPLDREVALWSTEPVAVLMEEEQPRKQKKLPVGPGPRFSKQNPPSPDSADSVGRSINREIEADPNPKHTRIAIVWTGAEGEDTDIDLWIRDLSSENEVSFQCRNQFFGTLSRDDQKGGSIDVDAKLESYECVTVFHTKIEKLVAWAHLYKGRGTSCTVFVKRGNEPTKKSVIVFEPTSSGDAQHGHQGTRESLPTWKKIDIGAILAI